MCGLSSDPTDPDCLIGDSKQTRHCPPFSLELLHVLCLSSGSPFFLVSTTVEAFLPPHTNRTTEPPTTLINAAVQNDHTTDRARLTPQHDLSEVDL